MPRGTMDARWTEDGRKMDGRWTEDGCKMKSLRGCEGDRSAPRFEARGGLWGPYIARFHFGGQHDIPGGQPAAGPPPNRRSAPRAKSPRIEEFQRVLPLFISRLGRYRLSERTALSPSILDRYGRGRRPPVCCFGGGERGQRRVLPRQRRRP